MHNVAELNVEHTIDRIRIESPIVAELERQGAIAIVGAMYDIDNGQVTFYE